MSLTIKQIRNLRALLQGESLAWSALSDDLWQLLLTEQLVVVRTHRSRKSIYTQDSANLESFIEQHFEELRGVDWDKDDYSIASNRAALAIGSGNSKSVMIRSCPGFMVNSFDPISAKVGDKDVMIAPEEGTMLFIADWEHFSIAENVLVIGVENMENFRRIREQRYLFPKNQPLLFISRYPQSTDLRQWLTRIPNTYLHYGDFDLAGLQIYEHEFYKHLGARASFFIPNDIEERINKGSAERYNDQYTRYKNYTPSDARLLPLYELIHIHHRCYDQEGYIQTQK